MQICCRNTKLTRKNIAAALGRTNNSVPIIPDIIESMPSRVLESIKFGSSNIASKVRKTKTEKTQQMVAG
jgi:hypothetical protein